MSTDKLTSVFVEEQFPYFLREDGAKIIDFIRKYYEAQEQDGNFIEVVKNLLTYADIDGTEGQYLEFMAREIIPHIPERLLVDRKLLMKHIQDVYIARGSIQGYKIFFRALFNEEIEVYIPGEDILRASDGRWVEETAIQINNFSGDDQLDLEGNIIKGASSNASAVVDRVEIRTINGVNEYFVYLQNVVGTFEVGETISNIDESISFTVSDSEIGPIDSVTVIDGGAYHSINDTVSILGTGAGAIGTVLQTTSDSAVEFYVANGGSGYSVNTELNFPTVVNGSGIGASFRVANIKAPYVDFNIYDDFIAFIADVPIGGALGANNNFAFAIANCNFWSANDYVSLQTGGSHGFSDDNTIGFYYISGNTSDIGITSGTAYYVVNSNTTAFQISAAQGGAAIDLLASGDGNVTRASANLALANAESVLESALGTSSVNTGTIDTVLTTSYGYGYTPSRPTGTIKYNQIADQQLDDGVGGIFGENADVQTNYLPGSISIVGIEIKGDNYSTGEIATLLNTTATGTINATASVIASPIINFDGKYVDTKGWLSWDKFLQDNLYYQEFSYEIRSTQPLNKYDTLTQDILHTAGTKKFGEIQFHRPVLIPEITSDNEIQLWNEIANTNIYVTFTQSNTVLGDSISSNSTPFGSVVANDSITISGSYEEDGTYRVVTVVNNSTLTVEDTDVTIKLAPTAETTLGYDFTANSIVKSDSNWADYALGDDVFVRNAINESNEGGPWIITSANNTHLRVEGYDSNTTPFVASNNDTSATVEVRRTYAFVSNTTLDLINIKIDRYGNTYPYSNNTVV